MVKGGTSASVSYTHLPQLFGEGAVVLFGGLGHVLLSGEHFAFDAQAYLVEFPVLETGDVYKRQR